MKVLLDNNIPVQIGRLLPEHEVKTARDMGWTKLVNGDLLKQAELAGFECLLTGDQNLVYQQNLKGRKIAILVTNIIDRTALERQIDVVRQALGRVSAGDYIKVELELPELRRRPHREPER